MKKIKSTVMLAVMLVTGIGAATAQTNVKLNALYAVAGVINPQIEMVISPHSSVSIDATYSPWRSIKGLHANFGMLTGEYRFYFKRGDGRGWYASGNFGMTGFDISKPSLFSDGKVVSFKQGYGKGFGFMLGFGLGYQHIFCERWIVDAFIAGDWFCSWYNGYSKEGVTNLYPNGGDRPDPFNASGEILPSKIGVSIGYRIIDPARPRKGTRRDAVEE